MSDRQYEMDAMLIIRSEDEQVSSRGCISNDQAVPGDYLPDLQTIIDTARYFRDAGFNVVPKRYLIKIKGPAGLFESIFGSLCGSSDSHACQRLPDWLRRILVRVVLSATDGRQELIAG